MTGVVVLGSTGSIGRQALEVIAAHPDRVQPSWGSPPGARRRSSARSWPTGRRRGRGAPTPARRDLSRERWAAGGLEELATLDAAEIVVVATTGMAALPAVLAALRSGRRVALANKETLVTGGHLVERAAGRARRRPARAAAPDRLGAFGDLAVPRRGTARATSRVSSSPPRADRSETAAAATCEAVTPDQALAHPTWQMGPKITIDSATLVNKAFEAIEARWLYRLPYDRIQAVIHPQSVVHSLVEFTDGSYKAQLGLPDMRLPIQYALTYPERLPSPARRSVARRTGETCGSSRWPPGAIPRTTRRATRPPPAGTAARS